MNISIPQNSHYGAAVDAFAPRLEKRTGGRYKIQNFYASALGNEREAIEAVQLGTLDIVMTSTGPVPNFVPEAAILDIPFLFRDYAHARATLDGPIGQDMLSKFEQQGLQGAGLGRERLPPHDEQQARRERVRSDLKGLKLRTMENPIHIQAYKGFGIIPTPMAISEVFTALQQGTVDGQENPISVIQSWKFDQVQKHLTLTGHVYSPAVILMSKGALGQAGGRGQDGTSSRPPRKAVKANRARIDDDEKNWCRRIFGPRACRSSTNVDRSRNSRRR